MGFPWPKIFKEALCLTCLVAQVFQYPDGLSHRTFAEGGCFGIGEPWKCPCKYPPITTTCSGPNDYCSTPSLTSSSGCWATTRGWRMPARRQGPALFPHQGPDGSTLREDQNWPSKCLYYFWLKDRKSLFFPSYRILVCVQIYDSTLRLSKIWGQLDILPFLIQVMFK